jgi:hypothetical protein
MVDYEASWGNPKPSTQTLSLEEQEAQTLKYNNFGMHSCHMEEVFDQ